MIRLKSTGIFEKKGTQMKLHKFGFEKTHVLRVGNGNARFEAIATSELSQMKTPMVYAWCGVKQNSREILYVGKAGSGVNVRLNQHESGFKYSKTGQKNLQLLLEKTAQGYTIEVCSRKSKSTNIFGVETSLYSTEEEALINLLSPQWNRASVKRVEKTSPGQPTQSYSLADKFDLSGVPKTDIAHQFFESLSPEDQHRFLQLLEYAVVLSEQQTLDVRIINGYQSQPKYYNQTPMMVFAQFHPSGRAKANSWQARIPLRCDSKAPLTIILPTRFKTASIPADEVWFGRDGFCPINVDDFLLSPERFVIFE